MERPWAVLITLLFALPSQAGVQMYYLHNDHLGTPRVVTDQAQQVVWKGHMKPFGEMEIEIEAITNHRRFPGQYSDIESRLYYNYFRDYDSSTGRYIQSDPIGIQGGLNTYAYVGGSPLMYVDPLGLYWFRQTWQTPGTIGRPNTPIPPGGTVGEFIERYVPAGYTFGEMHDNYVGQAAEAGMSDLLSNIPSMPRMFVAALGVELLRSLKILEQPDSCATE